jgi:hypothetical protein
MMDQLMGRIITIPEVLAGPADIIRRRISDTAVPGVGITIRLRFFMKGPIITGLCIITGGLFPSKVSSLPLRFNFPVLF